MRNPAITLANHTHRHTPVVSLCVEKDRRLFAKVKATRGAAWSQSRGFCFETKECFNIAFANHHFEKGMDLMLIQESLGHKSSKATEIYTHIARTALAKIKSQLDHIINSNDNNINKIQK
ncbi:MAG: tyrosine-type recombinase/integrase [Bacteroidales bacterium]|jgi:site-specific recombinase XerC|nr:tyrosine-type recombinase/integrase [Bacteroidales bacterium]